MRVFETGATRDDDSTKNDYEGFLSPLVIEAFGNYMTRHRVQADGSLRDSDNWAKGMSQAVYVKSAWRHFLDVWMIHRGHKRFDKKDGHVIDMEEACCALLFNVQGILHEYLSEKTVEVYENPKAEYVFDAFQILTDPSMIPGDLILADRYSKILMHNHKLYEPTTAGRVALGEIDWYVDADGLYWTPVA